MRRASKTVSYRPRRPSQLKRSKKKKINLKKVALFLAIIFLIVVVSLLVKYLKRERNVKLETIEWGATSQVQAMFAFDSALVKVDKEGIIYFETAEGEHIKQGQALVSVINQQEELKLKNTIRELEQKLGEFNVTTFTNNAEVTDKEAMHNKVRNLLDNLKVYRNHYSDSGKKAILEELDKTLTEFYSTQHQVTQDKQDYFELKKQLNIAKADYDHMKESVYSERDGIVTFELDGLEETLQYSKFPLNDYKWFNSKIVKNTISEGEEVNKDQYIAKVVSKDRFYVISKVPNDIAPKYIASEQAKVNFNEVSYQAKYITHQVDKKYTYLYYQVDKSPQTLIRGNKVELSTDKLKGMLVPKSAIEIIEEKSYVYKIDNKVYEKIKIEVIKEFDNEVLIKSIEEGVIIIKDTSYVRR